MRVGAVILNYNTWQLSANLALKMSSFQCVDQVYVVDNMSSDDSFDRLKQYSNDKIHVFQTDKNGGYSYGNNYGVNLCKEAGIGESFKAYAEEHYPSLKIDTVDMLDPDWRDISFSDYDIVYHVAGIAHADVGNVSNETKEKYYAVNTDLAVEVCEKAKAEGVKEFIFMSSMIVYGDSAPYEPSKIGTEVDGVLIV